MTEKRKMSVTTNLYQLIPKQIRHDVPSAWEAYLVVLPSALEAYLVVLLLK